MESPRQVEIIFTPLFYGPFDDVAFEVLQARVRHPVEILQ